MKFQSLAIHKFLELDNIILKFWRNKFGEDKIKGNTTEKHSVM